MVTISYAVTACNEHKELKRLLDQLVENKREVDEIVVQVDYETVTEDVMHMLRFEYSKDIASIIKHPLNKDFAAFKNNLKSKCSKDWILFIDADEYLSDELIDGLPGILILNNGLDLIWLPRVNTVYGLTEEDIARWGWRVDEHGRVNYPDLQSRLCKNTADIKWEGKVHEKLVGAKNFAALPEDYDLIHPKTIDRQRMQNNFYNTL